MNRKYFQWESLWKGLVTLSLWLQGIWSDNPRGLLCSYIPVVLLIVLYTWIGWDKYLLFLWFLFVAIFKTCGPLWAQQCGSQYYATGVCSEISPSFQILRSFSPAVQSKATCAKQIQLKKRIKRNQDMLCWGLLIWDFLKEVYAKTKSCDSHIRTDKSWSNADMSMDSLLWIQKIAPAQAQNLPMLLLSPHSGKTWSEVLPVYDLNMHL